MTSAVLLSLCVLAIHGAALVSWAHPDEVFLFDVLNKENPAFIRHRLHGLDVRHIFKASGSERYLVLVSNNQPGVLDSLDFPGSKKVTQLPVGPACQFLANYNVTGCQPMNAEMVDFDAADLAFLKFEFKPTGSIDMAELGDTLQEFEEVYTPAIQNVKSEVYYLVGRYPPRLYMFLNAGRDQVQQMVDSLVDKAGGPGNVLVNYQHLVEV